MNRIDRIFADLRREGRSGLMPFLTAGDPDLKTTAELIPAVSAAGAAICEIGIPFSDPVADGPVIQESMNRALEKGTRLADVFAMVADVRGRVEAGLVAMVSYSIVHRVGPARFIADAKAAGFDGFIFPDVPIEEASAIRERVTGEGLILSMLVAPTSSDARASQIAQASSGFVYVVSRAGITGEQRVLPAELPDRLRRLRGVTDLPLAVGFGISTAEHVRQVVEVADAAIVGSAMMRRVAANLDRGPEAIVADVVSLTRELATGLQPAPTAS